MRDIARPSSSKPNSFSRCHFHSFDPPIDTTHSQAQDKNLCFHTMRLLLMHTLVHVMRTEILCPAKGDIVAYRRYMERLITKVSDNPRYISTDACEPSMTGFRCKRVNGNRGGFSLTSSSFFSFWARTINRTYQSVIFDFARRCSSAFHHTRAICVPRHLHHKRRTIITVKSACWSQSFTRWN